MAVVIVTSFALGAQAQTGAVNQVATVLSAYRSYSELGASTIQVPTVTEVSFGDQFIERNDFAVYDSTTNSFEPYYFKQELRSNVIQVSATTPTNDPQAVSMTDGVVATYTEFPVPETGLGTATILVRADQPITSTAITTLLDNFVALPGTIEIRAQVDGQSRIVVATQRMGQTTVRFPQTTSSVWTITFTFGQPLRISELRLQQDNAPLVAARAIRFLAQPGHAYAVYFNSDRQVSPPLPEAGNLAAAIDVAQAPAIQAHQNPFYRVADVDADGIPDMNDNCVLVSNLDQKDINKNGRGDVCEDFDQDGVANNIDNCPNNPNRNQIDTDGDGIGDVCDTEESRITEKYPWFPWVGIGSAAVVLIVLFGLTARSTRK